MDSFVIIKPSGTLSPFVSHYWTLKAHTGPQAVERIIPCGSLSLIFHRADKMISVTEGIYQPRSFVSGISTRFTDLKSSGNLEMLAVVFKPLGAGVFLDIPLDEFRSLDVSFEDTGDKGLIELNDTVLTKSSDDASIASIEQFLISKLGGIDEYTFKRLSRAIENIDRDPEINVSAAAGLACLGQRQFQRVFTSHVGVRPKDFIRIIRFQRAIYTLQKEPNIGFAQLAQASGYFDQAHMIKEFREFSGYTPSQYLSVCDPYSDYFSAL